MSSTEFKLNVSEKLLWSDRPLVKISFTSKDLFIIPMAIIFIPLFSFVFFSFLNAPNLNWSLVPVIFIFLLVLFGFLYMTIGKKLEDLYYKSNTKYIITNKRVLTIYKKLSAAVFEIDLSNIKPSLSMKDHLYGTIELGSNLSQSSLSAFEYGWPSKEVLFKRLENVPNAAEVYKILIKAQNECIQQRRR